VGRVTVLVPTYNRGPYLREAMASVLAQTAQDLELVICDNASTDDTRDIVASFADERVRLVARPENVGMIENHRRALAEEAGDATYVVMISDDDLLEPTMVEETAAVLDENPSVGMVHGAFRLIGQHGEVLLEFADWTGDRDDDGIETGPEFLRRSMARSCRVCASTVMMRAAARVRVEPADYPPIDLGMWLRLAAGWDVAYLHHRLASYRIHGGTHSASFGEVQGAGYTFGSKLALDEYGVKLRFLDEHSDRVPNGDELRKLAGDAKRRALVLGARQATLPDRDLVKTARALRDALALDASVALDPEAWMLLGGSVIGPNMVRRIRGIWRSV
jgi:glycosyltransferase involved in cell wall biosynthesis